MNIETQKKIFVTLISLFMLYFIPAGISVKYTSNHTSFTVFISETVGSVLVLYLTMLVISLFLAPFYWLLSRKTMIGFHWAMCVIFTLTSYFIIIGASINAEKRATSKVRLDNLGGMSQPSRFSLNKNTKKRIDLNKYMIPKKD